MLQTAQNPQALLNQMAQNDPALQNAINIASGKNPQEIEGYIQNAMQTTGFVPQPTAVPSRQMGFDKFR